MALGLSEARDLRELLGLPKSLAVADLELEVGLGRRLGLRDGAALVIVRLELFLEHEHVLAGQLRR